VHASEATNHNAPVALDVLLVYDKQLLSELLKLSATEWFEKREQFKRDYPDDRGFEVWSWEFIPGQQARLVLPLRAAARAGVMFARYASRGEHRARIDPHTSLVVHLLENDFTVQLRP
jgi:type VI secretion system protein